jgi:hypothetical protein
MTRDVDRDRQAIFRSINAADDRVWELYEQLRKRAVVNNVMHCFAGHLQLASLHVRFRSARARRACVHAATPLHSGDGYLAPRVLSEVQIPAPGVCDAAECTSL